MRWPGDIRVALYRMMPRLQAEESIRFVNSVALGSGSLDKAAAAKVVQELNSAAAGVAVRASRASDGETHAATLRGMGIRVEEV